MKNLTKLLFVATLLIAAQACSDLIETETSTSLPPEKALSEKEGVEALRANLYGRIHSQALSTNYMLAPSALADGLTNTEAATRYRGYVTFGSGTNGSGVGTWAFSYNTINIANILINKISDGALDEATLKQFQGEALWFRAFGMHNLMKAYAFEPGMMPSSGKAAGWDWGIPLRLEGALTTENTKYHSRKKVNVVYDQIIADLKKSIEYLTGNDSGDTRYITEAAAHALLARVYLYAAGNENQYPNAYENANQQAAKALQTTKAKLVQPDGIAKMFDETAGLNPGAIFVGVIEPSTESVGVNDALNVYTADQWVALVPTQEIMDLYPDEDARLSWFAPCYNEANSKVPSGCVAHHSAIDYSEYSEPDEGQGLEIQKWNAEAGQQADDVPYLRVAEMLLIQAEARAKGANGNPLDPLNKLRKARGIDAYSGSDIMQAVLDERRREFIAEGHRFWDLKRLGKDIPKVGSQIKFSPLNVPERIVYQTNYQMIDKISSTQIQQSQDNAPEDSVLVQNPGY